MRIKTFQIIVVILISLSFSNCARYKKIVLLNDVYKSIDSTSVNHMNAKFSETILKTNDKVFLSLHGLDYEQTESFNKQSRTTSYNDISVFLQSYIIDSEGLINIPILGKVLIVGLTVNGAEKLIQDKVDEYLIGVTVELRLMSFEVSIMGDVKQPNKYLVLKQKINVFEAISLSGGFTAHADLSKVMVIRDVGDYSETAVLDLTNSEIFDNAYYWLRPNDIVYVKPMRSKALSINSQTISITLSGLTTLLLFLTYFQ
ncbi:MAG: polysaccharide biosynthesis/export family protein [Salinivirgaceae bacterium]|nr:polysaccharide biosynthesis/export family protein [Salinivirgaceae bacterium]